MRLKSRYKKSRFISNGYSNFRQYSAPVEYLSASECQMRRVWNLIKMCRTVAAISTFSSVSGSITDDGEQTFHAGISFLIMTGESRAPADEKDGKQRENKRKERMQLQYFFLI